MNAASPFFPYSQHLPQHPPPGPYQQYHDPALASLAYAPLQHLPLQQLDPVYSQHHLVLSPAATSFHQAQPQQQQHLQQPAHQIYQPHDPTFCARQRHTRSSRVAMASYPQQDMSEEQLSEFQKLSNEYVPEVTGPLVGERQSSTAIAVEYASADPVFQAKTEALPQKYSHYRTVRGDGSCGWRAVAFGYFEALIHHGDPNRFLEEETRLRSSSNILNMAGFDPFIYEDFADAMFDLLRDVANAMQTGQAEQTLLAAFNDESNQASILTYLKTLTAAWMKTRPQDYAPWLLEQTVDEYCNASVMPTSAEIENVGLSALKDAFLSPAGITLEVLYLDRSEGSEVNMHRFSPVNHGGFDVGTVRLLYRPGHYDLLYKLQDLPHAPASVPTYLQIGSHVHREPISAIGMPDFMTGFAGMSYVSPHQAWVSYPGGYGEFEGFASPTALQHCTHALPNPSVTASPPGVQSHSMYAAPDAAPHLLPSGQMSMELAVRTLSQAGMVPQPGWQQQLGGGPFRPSAWELEPDIVQATAQSPLQTAMFRNSHYNTAHFMNPDFQPEEWHPEDEYILGNGKPTRHRNSG